MSADGSVISFPAAARVHTGRARERLRHDRHGGAAGHGGDRARGGGAGGNFSSDEVSGTGTPATYAGADSVVPQFSFRKSELPTGADVVEDAARKAERLLAAEHQGLGDQVDIAMQRAASRWGIPASVFHALRYRKRELKDVRGSILRRLDAAVAYLEARAEAGLRADLERTRRVLGDAADGNAAVRAATALVGPETGAEEVGAHGRQNE